MLEASLTAANERDEGIDLALIVANEGDEPVTLRFRTGQRADFAAYDAADRDEGRGVPRDDPEADPVWRHGEGRLFTQALGSETLEPGASATYEGTWAEPPPGTYLIVGSLTAEAHDASAVAEVTVD
jgi:hypothetical protein